MILLRQSLVNVRRRTYRNRKKNRTTVVGLSQELRSLWLLELTSPFRTTALICANKSQIPLR